MTADQEHRLVMTSDRLAELLKLASNDSGETSNDKPPGVRVGDICSNGWRLEWTMPSEPCLIQGPCFDCDEVCDCEQYVWLCHCHGYALDEDKTAPTPKLEPEDLRPNVPPRMM